MLLVDAALVIKVTDLIGLGYLSDDLGLLVEFVGQCTQDMSDEVDILERLLLDV